ncbi:MAG TPA: flagellar basal body P-ring formation chaperone FlgA [Planctomycetaceae bacterium]|nr:flagellar basal body P-ring formation chaperone FlgA [Planctomycetaceae bacterium]
MSAHLRFLASLLLACLATVAANAATIRFRPAATVEATIITLGDVADVVDADADRAQRLRSIQLVPAPVPGRTLRLEFGIVRSRLQAHGINLADLEFAGHSAVEVRRAETRALRSGGEASPAQHPEWKKQRAERLVAEAIREHCRRQAPELGVVQVSVELRPEDVDRVVAASGQAISVAGLNASAPDAQPTTVRLTSRDGRPEDIPVTAGVRPWPWVLAAGNGIAQGQRLQTADLAWVQVETSDGLFTDVERLIGQETAQPIRAGQPVRAGDVRSVPLVRNGDIVTVASRRAGIVVRRPMKARGDGGLGEEILLTTLDGRERLSARVTGFHEAEVGERSNSLDARQVAEPPGQGLRVITETAQARPQTPGGSSPTK